MGIWRRKKEGGEQSWRMEGKCVVKEGRDKVRRDKEIVKRENIDFAMRKIYCEKDEKRLYKKKYAVIRGKNMMKGGGSW
jgi:hypothetical protein